MHPTKVLALGATGALAAMGAAMPVPPAGAAPTPATVAFTGTVTTAMGVDNGTNQATVPAGTPYSGSFTYDSSQAATPVSSAGGTHTVYTFRSLVVTVGTSTVTSGPGTIDVFDNLTTASGYPTGDSVYVNFTQGIPNTMGVAPNGLLDGAAFNWMGLAFLDAGGTAVTNGQLPTSFAASAFPAQFSEFNFGSAGTPFGAGNTSTIQSLTTGGAPLPAPLAFAPALTTGIVGTAYSSTFDAASGGTGPYTYTASGLPAGLSLSGNAVYGTPTAAGMYNVTISARDSAGVVVTVQVPLGIGSTGHFSVPEEGQGAITRVGAHDAFLKVGTLKLVWTSSTEITVTTRSGVQHVIGSAVTAGMTVRYEGLATKSGSALRAQQLTIG